MKYIFRGNVVLDYDQTTKQLKAPMQTNGIPNIDFCQFIPEDYKLLAKFFEDAYRDTINDGDTKLEDIVVN